MNQEKLIYFKGLLEGKIRALLEEAEKAVNGMGQERSEDFPDPDRPSLFGIGPEFPAQDQGP
jgi:hypothetical protein